MKGASIFSMRPPDVLERLKKGTLLGYYSLGGLPTVVADSKLEPMALAHEAQHSTDLQYTYFGQLLLALLDLQESRKLSILNRFEAKRQIRKTAKASWDLLEGSAVSAEFFTLLLDSNIDLIRSFELNLPLGYKRAFHSYRRVLDDLLLICPILHPRIDRGRGQLLMGHLSAITELSLDLDILDAQFESLTLRQMLRLFKTISYSANFNCVTSAILGLDWLDFSRRLEEANNAPDDYVPGYSDANLVEPLARLPVVVLKEALYSKLRGPQNARFVRDTQRLERISLVRKELETSYSDIAKRHYAGSLIYGHRTDFLTGKPAAPLKEVAVEPATFVSYATSEVDANFELIGQLIFCCPTERDHLVCQQFLFGQPASAEYAVGVGGVDGQNAYSLVSEADLRHIDQVNAEKSFGWIHMAFVNAKDNRIWPLDLARSMKSRSYLAFDEFTNVHLDYIERDLSTKIEYRVRKSRNDRGLLIFTANCGNLKFCWVQSDFGHQKHDGHLLMFGRLFKYEEIPVKADLLDAAYAIIVNVLPFLMSAFREKNKKND